MYFSQYINSNFEKNLKLKCFKVKKIHIYKKILADLLLNKKEFLEENGQRTLFYIECTNGKLIENYSYPSANDAEMLLLSGTEFLATGKKRADRVLTIVHLREIPAKNPTPDGYGFCYF